MSRKTAAIVRSLTAGLALLVALVAAPPAALAETTNIWKSWAEDLGDRENKIEIPFLVIVSIAPMILITPIWAVQLGIAAAKGDD